jgi:phospholipid-binding lipoprotein MlaA
MTTKYKFLFVKFIIALFILNGCSNSTKFASENKDPFEKINRNIFQFNKFVDQKIISPISKTYVKKVPAKIRSGVSNHLQWMDTPNTIINSALQTDMENSILASAKFLLNGLTLGFYDLDKGETVIEKRDFGSTLARLNVSEGHFLMVPLIGPKTTRDLTGTIIDRKNMATLSSNSIDDLSLAEVPINIIDKRSKMSKTLDKIYLSADPYIKVRSFYLQNRRNEIYSEKYIENKNNNLDAEFEKLLD